MSSSDRDFMSLHHMTSGNQFLAILIVILIIAACLGGLTLFGIILD